MRSHSEENKGRCRRIPADPYTGPEILPLPTTAMQSKLRSPSIHRKLKLNHALPVPSPIPEESSSALSSDSKPTVRGAGDNMNKHYLRQNHSVPELKSNEKIAKNTDEELNALQENALKKSEDKKACRSQVIHKPLEFSMPGVSIKCEASTTTSKYSVNKTCDNINLLQHNVRTQSLSKLQSRAFVNAFDNLCENSKTPTQTVRETSPNESCTHVPQKCVSRHNLPIECKALRNASVSRHRNKRNQIKESLRQKTLKKNCMAKISKIYNLDIDPKYYEYIKIEQLQCTDILKELPNVKDLKEPPPPLSPYSPAWQKR